MRENFHTGNYSIQAWRVSPALMTAVLHATLFALCGLCAFLLRFEFDLPKTYVLHVWWGMGIWVVIKSAVFHVAGLNRIWSRHVSLPDVIDIWVGNCLGSIAAGAAITLLAPGGFPRSVYLIDFLTCLVVTVGIRAIARLAHGTTGRTTNPHVRKRALIYGAGDAGVMLVRELRSNPSLGYDIRGFIDDSARKTGMIIHRIPVLGRGTDLPALARKHQVEEIIITIPSASGPDIARILQYCHDAGVRCKTMPSISEWIEGAGAVAQIRDVAVEDLLGRNPVVLEQVQIVERLQDRVVMVTGAAGSIGSELCRQIARFSPRALIGFELAETSMFYLQQEMQSKFPDVPFYPEIGSIQNVARLREVMRTYEPSIVYHAAAYKHVPLMEAHVVEAVENNVFGTWNVATVAAEFGAEDFVMISSDKAVHPTSIMGTTKRVAEMLIASLQTRHTKYLSVRFGNVLGSNGSVIPTFKKQIAAGGPVTVTHPEMQRYFMTIPEAAQLVLQASTMGNGNDIFVLDMGQPVKIVDLARNLILLSGFRPGDDIKIEFSGLRPGEKLYEELNTLNENTKDTYHEKIKIFTGNAVMHDFLERLDNLRRLCQVRDVRGIVLELKEIVPEYNPGTHLLRYILAGTESGDRTERVNGNRAATASLTH